MRFLKSGFAGIATVAAIAVLSTLTPGASATTAPSAAGTSAVKASATQASTAKQGTLTTMVKGTFSDGTVTGTFSPERFLVQNDGVYGVGTLHATVRKTDGTLVGRVDRMITIPVKTASYPSGVAAEKTCDILDLVLGPLHLNLLGLHVDLKKVVLHITAESGPGNLLGNLLCAVAHLLDGTTLKQLLKLSNLLNQILTLLGV